MLLVSTIVSAVATLTMTFYFALKRRRFGEVSGIFSHNNQQQFSKKKLNSDFEFLERGRFKEYIAAVWVTDGADRCILGYLPDKYMGFADVLEGRLAQVVDIFFLSGCTIKKHYSDAHSGVCLAAIIDRSVPGELGMNVLVWSKVTVIIVKTKIEIEIEKSKTINTLG